MVRLDGDIVCLTPNWAQIVARTFDEGEPMLGVIGPKQLRVDGRIHAFGDFVLHPNGYTHVASGLPRHAVKHEMEVDHVMGCFYCHKREVWEQIGGYDERMLRGQTEDVSLRARLKGWKCKAVPSIEFVHRHVLRNVRSNEADTPEGMDKSMRVFERKWGFNRLAPDLDMVKQRFKGTPLLWNRQWFDDDARSEAPQVPLTLATSTWSRYANDEAFRDWVNLRVGLALSAIRPQGKAPLHCPVLLGCGDGLISHLLALNGVTTLSLDDRAEHIAFARQITAQQKYPAEAPQFEMLDDRRQLPLSDGYADLLLMYDMLERHPNPVGLLREARRVLQPERTMIVVSQRKEMSLEDPTNPATINELATEHRFLWMELLNVIQSLRAWEFLTDVQADDPRRDMVVVLRRTATGDIVEVDEPEILEAAS